MELLIAGAIGLVGYNLSKTAPARPGDSRAPQRRVAQLGPSTEYAEPGNSTLQATRDHVRLATRRWQEARDPALTGIVSPNTKLQNAMVPFFRSAKTQNTNDAVKQTLLEAFTGETSMDTSLTGTYRRKREVEAMFAPRETAVPVSSGGSSGNRAYERDLQRYEPGIAHNNVLPSEQVRVGRGVGVGPDVSATDGFHPMYRVMMKNVGDYKKNTLPGQVNHGVVPVAQTSSQGPAASSKLDVNPNGVGALVYDQVRRPMMPAGAAVHAATEHPEYSPLTRKAWLHEGDRFGIATHTGPSEMRGWTEVRNGGVDDTRRNAHLPAMNLTGAVAGMGGFVVAPTDDDRLECERRERRGDVGGLVTGPAALTAPTQWLAPPTQREQESGHVGAPGAAASKGYAVPAQDAPRMTLRDAHGGPLGLTGAAAVVKTGTMQNARRYKRLGREAIKRENVEDYAPLPGRINATTTDMQLVHPSRRMRADRNDARPPLLPVLPNTTYNRDLGRLTTGHNKLPVGNPRLDLDVAAQQLKDNPFAHTLWNQ